MLSPKRVCYPPKTNAVHKKPPVPSGSKSPSVASVTSVRCSLPSACFPPKTNAVYKKPSVPTSPKSLTQKSKRKKPRIMSMTLIPTFAFTNQDGPRLTLQSGEGYIVHIFVLEEDILRVMVLPKGKLGFPRTWAIAPGLEMFRLKVETALISKVLPCRRWR